MKRILLLPLLLFSIVAYSQEMEISPSNELENWYDVSEYPSEYIYVENVGSESIAYEYEVLSNSVESIGWTATLCTNLGCFPDVPSTGSVGTLATNGEGFFNPHVSFNGLAGTGEIVLQISESQNPDNVEVITFIFHAEGTTNIAQNSAALNVTTFPNPTTDWVYLKANQDMTSTTVVIWGLNGQVVNTASMNQKNRVYIGDLETGIYILGLIDNHGAVSWKGQFLKQ